MEIVFDDREKRGLEHAVTEAGLSVTWERLHDAGDILIKLAGVPVFGIERKAGSDITASLKSSHHLFHQRDQMLDWSRRTGARVALLIECPEQHGWQGQRDGINSKYVEAVILSTTLLKGLYLMRTRDPRSTVEAVKYLAEKIAKEFKTLNCPPCEFWSARAQGVDQFKAVVAMKGGRRANMDGRNAYVAMLQQVPGISHAKALAVAEVYTMSTLMDTLREFAGKKTNPVSNLEVKGRKLGPAIAQKLSAILL
jgi:ERCC4-type nuclease